MPYPTLLEYTDTMIHGNKSILDQRKRYLQVALNSTLDEARSIITSLPVSDRILYEAGTPLIKRYGMEAIATIRQAHQLRNFAAKLSTAGSVSAKPYIVADLKTFDRAEAEVVMAAQAGASAAIALGAAPKETLDTFVETCARVGIDSMIDMMNVEFPLSVMRSLKQPPHVVIIHRGVDEERVTRGKQIALHEIRRIKGAYDVRISIAGGDTPREVQSAIFNDADIVVIWKSVYKKNADTNELVTGFLKNIK